MGIKGREMFSSHFNLSYVHYISSTDFFAVHKFDLSYSLSLSRVNC